ncbi:MULTISPECIES: methylated-DNA--[protein]-cysteine S-methyltransferase [unclassified Thalassospira]|uniref:methylated-DNA--[protein]-cysteine S-methyltransferase n=1 Tax=unclassified Thalassospira TaxID=2648997 RepID=UPI000EBE0984|nr:MULTISPECIES: methylated-DNA--[protein]-cysteine S-methyltransferase [unclassified Thalassospira]HAI32182.1 cysteine methyltransferase [Thalassospira sp.]|tara:strand:+ start:367 stop:855 length:489 start_codon:yes stop_codon:yes gene_type:complete
MPQISINSPVGAITVFAFEDQIVALDWGFVDEVESTPVLEEAQKQLTAYFAGRLHSFDLPLAPDGTDFQKIVWQAMGKIPMGQTATYKELAAMAGSPKAFQSVGTACGLNPIPIIIPCHRVLAAGDKPGGYSGHGGLETKRALLKIEGVDLPLPDDQGDLPL